VSVTVNVRSFDRLRLALPLMPAEGRRYVTQQVHGSADVVVLENVEVERVGGAGFQKQVDGFTLMHILGSGKQAGVERVHQFRVFRVKRQQMVGDGIADPLGVSREPAVRDGGQEIHQCRFDRLARLAPDLSHDMGSVDAGDLLRQRVDSAAAQTGGNNGGGEYATNLAHGSLLPGGAFSDQ
jgi:hypothetical protein